MLPSGLVYPPYDSRCRLEYECTIQNFFIQVTGIVSTTDQQLNNIQRLDSNCPDMYPYLDANLNVVSEPDTSVLMCLTINDKLSNKILRQ